MGNVFDAVSLTQRLPSQCNTLQMTGDVADLYLSWECSFSEKCNAGKILVDDKYCITNNAFIAGTTILI